MYVQFLHSTEHLILKMDGLLSNLLEVDPLENLYYLNENNEKILNFYK